MLSLHGENLRLECTRSVHRHCIFQQIIFLTHRHLFRSQSLHLLSLSFFLFLSLIPFLSPTPFASHVTSPFFTYLYLKAQSTQILFMSRHVYTKIHIVRGSRICRCTAKKGKHRSQLIFNVMIQCTSIQHTAIHAPTYTICLLIIGRVSVLEGVE